MCELGLFIRIRKGRAPGLVTLEILSADDELVCSHQLSKKSEAVSLCNLIVGAAQLHDPEAMIVLEHDL